MEMDRILEGCSHGNSNGGTEAEGLVVPLML